MTMRRLFALVLSSLEGACCVIGGAIGGTWSFFLIDGGDVWSGVVGVDLRRSVCKKSLNKSSCNASCMALTIDGIREFISDVRSGFFLKF